ncbi:nedd8-conjugating enzyme UBE2F, partial [Tulasnella sp. 408]
AGYVEIAPEAWKLATRGVIQFSIGILDEEEMVQEAEEVKKEHVQERAMRSATPPPPKRSKAPRTSGASSGSSKKAFWIIVRTMTGRSIPIAGLHGSDDVLTLKAKVQDETGICPKEQRLIIKGKTLEDDRTLAYHSIKSGGVLSLALKLQGGKPVIYLYPPTTINAKICLSLVHQWSLSAVYPQVINGSFKEGKSSQTAEWEVVAHPSGMMAVDGSSTEVAYIFWEAE